MAPMGTSAAKAERLVLFRELALIRRFEEYIESVYMTDILKTPVHLSIGQEAIAVGVCRQLRRTDRLFTTYRNHAHYIAKGGNLKALADELNNRATGCSGGRGGSMHVIDLDAGIPGTTAIVGGAVPLAVGSGMASKFSGDGSITVTFFGDGASEEGGTYESLNFAAVHNLPVLFVCENNQYAIYSPQNERASTASIVERFKGLGLTSLTADGNDLDEVMRVAAEAIALVRSGRPVLLEVSSMLMREHVGTGIRAKQALLGEEWGDWEDDCPLRRFERTLVAEGVSLDELAHIDSEVRLQVAELFRQSLDQPLPDPASVADHVLA